MSILFESVVGTADTISHIPVYAFVYTLSLTHTGYPLTALSAACQEPLLAIIHSCPPLAQEAIFRYSVDQLLSEVKAELPSYGTRIILQLLMQCRPDTCTECTQKVRYEHCVIITASTLTVRISHTPCI